MAEQKQAVLDLVARHQRQGRALAEVLSSVGVARSSYYRWKKTDPGEKSTSRQSSYEITPRNENSLMGSRSTIRSIATGASKGSCKRGIYLSASVIYGHLKQQGQIEPYERRVAPWKIPRYEVWQRNQMWGSDWSKLSVGG